MGAKRGGLANRRPPSQPDRNLFLHRTEEERKVLTPNDFPDLNAVAERRLDFQYYWATTAQPFEWKFNPQDLDELLVKLSTRAYPSKNTLANL